MDWYPFAGDTLTAAGIRGSVAGPNMRAVEQGLMQLEQMGLGRGIPVPPNWTQDVGLTNDMLWDMARYMTGTPMSLKDFGPKRGEFAEAWYDPDRFVMDRWQGRATTLGLRTRSGLLLPGNLAKLGLGDLERTLSRAVKSKDWTSGDAPSVSQRRAGAFAGQ